MKPNRFDPDIAVRRIDRFMRLDEVVHTIGLSRNTVYRWIREEKFPRQVRIGPNSVAWRESENVAWMAALAVGNGLGASNLPNDHDTGLLILSQRP